jgi:hypothetical protein
MRVNVDAAYVLRNIFNLQQKHNSFPLKFLTKTLHSDNLQAILNTNWTWIITIFKLKYSLNIVKMLYCVV